MIPRECGSRRHKGNEKAWRVLRAVWEQLGAGADDFVCHSVRHPRPS